MHICKTCLFDVYSSVDKHRDLGLRRAVEINQDVCRFDRRHVKILKTTWHNNGHTTGSTGHLITENPLKKVARFFVNGAWSWSNTRMSRELRKEEGGDALHGATVLTVNTLSTSLSSSNISSSIPIPLNSPPPILSPLNLYPVLSSTGASASASSSLALSLSVVNPNINTNATSSLPTNLTATALAPVNPPLYFGIVESDVFRCNKFESSSFTFVSQLALNTVVYLSSDDVGRELTDFFKERDIHVIHLGAKYRNKNVKGICEGMAKEAIECILDQRRYPIMVMCKTGVHLSGYENRMCMCVCVCMYEHVYMYVWKKHNRDMTNASLSSGYIYIYIYIR